MIMNYNQILLFADLDDTLLNSKKEISQENKEAILTFNRHGGIFSVCSGRNEINTMTLVDPHLISGPSVLYNGSVVYDFAQKRYLHMETLKCSLFDEFFSDFMTRYPSVDAMIYQKGEINYITPYERVYYEHYALHAPCNFLTWNQVRAKGDLIKILLCGDQEELLGIRQAITSSPLNQSIDCVRSNAMYLEILPKNIHKGTGMDFILKQPDYANKTVIAIGDYDNDLPMLKKADIAICPENALSKVKKISDYIVSSCDQHALYDLICHLIPTL